MFLFISQFTIKLATKAQRTDRPFGSRAFAVFGPMCWNSLPSALKSSSVQCATLSEQFWITEDDSYGAGVVIIPTADLFFFHQVSRQSPRKRLYLTRCASSVPVESLLSVTGLIKNGRRSFIALYRLNKLCFVHIIMANSSQCKLMKPSAYAVSLEA